MKSTIFKGNILVLGCGSITQCSIPLLIRDHGIDPKHITILDMVDNRARIAEEIKKGIKYEILKITPENIKDVLSSRLKAGDILLDLAWNIDTALIIDWCHHHGVSYLNTSVELWDPYKDAASKHPLDRTLYPRHMDLRKMVNRWGHNKGPTAIVEHGANPGLVSHFVKYALKEISEKLLNEASLEQERRTSLETALDHENFPTLAMLTGTKVVHIAERDTQITNQPKAIDEFVNTWSVEGFYEEGVAPAEMGWGTHEKTLPHGAFVHKGDGPCNQICLARPGMKTHVRSWVPSGPITGMVVRHGESFTMSDHLTVWKDGKTVYRPTVHYSYCPTDAAINSVYDLEMREWRMPPKRRIMNNEIISGREELGVLLMGHDFRSWWTGSILSIDEARSIISGQSATTVQVAAGVVSAFMWLINNPNRGYMVPDDLPWKEVLDIALPYLGTFHSQQSNWDPISTPNDLFASFNGSKVDASDPWQFHNFLR